MSDIKCVLDIMKQNEYIEMKTDTIDSVPHHQITCKIKQKEETLMDKIEQKMEDSDKYIIHRQSKKVLLFTHKKDLYDFLDKNQSEETICHIPHYVRKFINDHIWGYRITSRTGYNTLYNLKIKEERELKELKDANKALELLDNIL